MNPLSHGDIGYAIILENTIADSHNKWSLIVDTDLKGICGSDTACAQIQRVAARFEHIQIIFRPLVAGSPNVTLANNVRR